MSDVHTVQRDIDDHLSLAHIPPEIRFQIYDTINEPRLVELRYDSRLTTFWSPTRLPMGLHICQESRHETKSRYTLGFGGIDGDNNVWFNFTRDALYFGMYSLQVPSLESLGGASIFFEADEGRRVRHLAVHAEVMGTISQQLAADVEHYKAEGDDPWNAHLMLLPEFHLLETLTIVGVSKAQFNPEMYKTLCARAKDEELWGWNIPKMRYVIDTPEGYIVEEIEDESDKKGEKDSKKDASAAANSGDVASDPAADAATDAAAQLSAESAQSVAELIEDDGSMKGDDAAFDLKDVRIVAVLAMTDDVKDINVADAALEATTMDA